ncbi:MAG: type II toxin-antitoxin system RelE/ParE family toxin [Coriobacteriia bacterium]|nr:type II toxin-antitoxin system RelE/ParE family toxin [Coriobacteriia bacterium]
MKDGDDPKEYAVIIEHSVYDRMFQHMLFLAEVDVDAAKELEERLYEGISSLKIFPFRNPIYENRFILPGRYRSLLIGKYHRIVYAVEGGTVYVDNIIDCRADDGSAL